MKELNVVTGDITRQDDRERSLIVRTIATHFHVFYVKEVYLM